MVAHGAINVGQLVDNTSDTQPLVYHSDRRAVFTAQFSGFNSDGWYFSICKTPFLSVAHPLLGTPALTPSRENHWPRSLQFYTLNHGRSVVTLPVHRLWSAGVMCKVTDRDVTSVSAPMSWSCLVMSRFPTPRSHWLVRQSWPRLGRPCTWLLVCRCVSAVAWHCRAARVNVVCVQLSLQCPAVRLQCVCRQTRLSSHWKVRFVIQH